MAGATAARPRSPPRGHRARTPRRARPAGAPEGPGHRLRLVLDAGAAVLRAVPPPALPGRRDRARRHADRPVAPGHRRSLISGAVPTVRANATSAAPGAVGEVRGDGCPVEERRV